MTEHVHSWAIMENTSREPAYLLCLCGELRSVSPHPSFTCPVEREEGGVPTPGREIDWGTVAVIVAMLLFWGLIAYAVFVLS